MNYNFYTKYPWRDRNTRIAGDNQPDPYFLLMKPAFEDEEMASIEVIGLTLFEKLRQWGKFLHFQTASKHSRTLNVNSGRFINIDESMTYYYYTT